MKILPLRNGANALLDDEDYERLKIYKWFLHQYPYTARHGKMMYMHHLVLRTKSNRKLWVDHINRNKLDNRKSNLRLVAPRLNKINSGYKHNNYIGVNTRQSKNGFNYSYYVKDKSHNGVHCGGFKEKRWAAMARDMEVRAGYGDIAAFNFRPDNGLVSFK